ncbi:proline-tRNA ligase [Batrachochytrium salamandrivorans]|nr:proline-tRNA ligase [Batrachochytrium salamandrivorans]
MPACRTTIYAHLIPSHPYSLAGSQMSTRNIVTVPNHGERCRPPPSVNDYARLSKLLLPTSKDSDPSANSASHDLLLRGGFIRQSSAGIYSYLPFGLRVLDKLEAIIDDEMQHIGGQKISLPCLLSSAPWKATGRWETTGPEMFKVKDRKNSEFLLSPTHEEEITSLVASLVSSHRQLPLRLYQIGRKYRDELRPRSGLLRAREFIMKDMYSFDSSEEAALDTYTLVQSAYHRILSRIGIPFVVAEADTGNIGGTRSHEYHFTSSVGEDTVLACSECGYIANEEKAIGVASSSTAEVVDVNFHKELEAHPVRESSVSCASRLVAKSPSLSIKYYKLQLQDTEERDLAVVYLSGRTINPLHLKKLPELADLCIKETVAKRVESTGSAGVVVLDESPLTSPNGEISKPISGHLKATRAIEIGHTFYLGTKYSEPLNAKFMSPTQGQHTIIMGCYGMGVSRMVSAIVEASHDKNGIIWPLSVAPYKVCIIALPQKNNADNQAKVDAEVQRLVQVFGSTYGKSNIVVDDRDFVQYGYKMKDAQLVGYPFVAIVGKSFLEKGTIELHSREKGTIEHVLL